LVFCRRIEDYRGQKQIINRHPIGIKRHGRQFNKVTNGMTFHVYVWWCRLAHVWWQHRLCNEFLSGYQLGQVVER